MSYLGWFSFGAVNYGHKYWQNAGFGVVAAIGTTTNAGVATHFMLVVITRLSQWIKLQPLARIYRYGYL